MLRRLLLRIEDGLLVVLLSGMILLASAQILLRNLFDSGLIWADPTLRVLVLWLTMLGAMVATREHHHIHIDLLGRFLPPRLRPWIQGLTDLFAALVCGLLAWHSGRFVWLEFQDGGILFATLPAWLCELVMPLGFGVMSLRFLLQVGRPQPLSGS
ncbi:MAG: TRAP transporter small permease [Chromatiales bacterium]|jgi:TRAP-type C4-dicarboxylate transport system permease small subunit